MHEQDEHARLISSTAHSRAAPFHQTLKSRSRERISELLRRLSQPTGNIHQVCCQRALALHVCALPHASTPKIHPQRGL
jgi:hypothetical protein